MPIDQVVLEKVQTIVTEVLGAEAADVTPEALFDADLGGESLDLLDMGFRCERAFGVRVKFQDLTAQDLTVGPDGTLSADSLARLQARFPALNVARWESRRFNRPLELLTVEDIAAVVASEIQRAGRY